jgi:hypothetical protein
MFNEVLTGPWLLGALALSVLVGVFVSRYVKDVFKGVPSSLRTALNNTESSALAALKAAEAKAISDVTGTLPGATATTAPAAPAVTSVAESDVKSAASAAVTKLGEAGADLKADIESAISDVVNKHKTVAVAKTAAATASVAAAKASNAAGEASSASVQASVAASAVKAS